MCSDQTSLTDRIGCPDWPSSRRCMPRRQTACPRFTSPGPYLLYGICLETTEGRYLGQRCLHLSSHSRRWDSASTTRLIWWSRSPSQFACRAPAWAVGERRFSVEQLRSAGSAICDFCYRISNRNLCCYGQLPRSPFWCPAVRFDGAMYPRPSRFQKKISFVPKPQSKLTGIQFPAWREFAADRPLISVELESASCHSLSPQLPCPGSQAV